MGGSNLTWVEFAAGCHLHDPGGGLTLVHQQSPAAGGKWETEGGGEVGPHPQQAGTVPTPPSSHLLCACRLLTVVEQVELAITMYKKKRMFDDVIRLVARYHPEFLKETHVHLAKAPHPTLTHINTLTHSCVFKPFSFRSWRVNPGSRRLRTTSSRLTNGEQQSTCTGRTRCGRMLTG